MDRQPPLDMLVTDPVYQDYVWLEYQQQQIRLERERARADRLANRLRALGLDPEAER